VIGGELINVIIELNESKDASQTATLHLREKAIGTLCSILHDSMGDWDNIGGIENLFLFGSVCLFRLRSYCCYFFMLKFSSIAIYFPFLLYLIEEIGSAMTWWDQYVPISAVLSSLKF
jgi:hypothetical protein